MPQRLVEKYFTLRNPFSGQFQIHYYDWHEYVPSDDDNDNDTENVDTKKNNDDDDTEKVDTEPPLKKIKKDSDE
jgi:hypothetical protein